MTMDHGEEALMEKLRAKAADMKSLAETAKIIRMGMADRRHSLDINDKAIFRTCLDTLQSSISVKTVAGMSERLETVARQLQLKFMAANPTPGQHSFYISTEMFYLEIGIDNSGVVAGTNIHHQNMQGGHHGSLPPSTQPCPEITECLTAGDFTTFVKHLEGLSAVYNLPDCSGEYKSSAWQALWTLEHDLMLIASQQSWVTDMNHLIHKTGLGLLHNRAGGLPMKLRFFLPPYELLDTKAKTILPMSQETIVSKDLGLTATVALKHSRDTYLLPLTSVMSTGGKTVNQLPISSSNAVPLPAHFVLSLDTPLPISCALIRHITSITDIEWLDTAENSPLLQLIAKQASNGSLDPSNNRGLFVTLPDQQHCYFMTETPDLLGQLVTDIPFRHPAQVPVIVDVLRRQAVFNTLIASCVRVNSLEDVDTSIMFEVTCLDTTCSSLTITFEHPGEETMATAELTLTDITSPKCRVFTTATVCPEDIGNKVLQRCLSIPVTMRAVIRRCQGDVKPHSGPDDDIAVSNVDNHVMGNGGMEGDHGSKSLQGGMGSGSRLPQRLESVGNRLVGSLGTPAVCDPGGGPGGGRVMDMDTTNTNINETESLNMHGPQDAELLPGAQSTTVNSQMRGSRPTRTPSTANQAEKPRRKSSGIDSQTKSEPMDHGGEGCLDPLNTDLNYQELGLSSLGVSVSKVEKLSGKLKPKDRHRSEGLQQASAVKPHSKWSVDKPSVSITPISGAASGDGSDDPQRRNSATSGIEIIPLGGANTNLSITPVIPGSQPKSKPRDLKRSFSEDDKRKLLKKDKKRRDDMKHRNPSVSPSRRPDSKGQDRPDGGSILSKSLPKPDPKAKLAGVIERLAYQTGDAVGIEIKPASRAGTPDSLKVDKESNVEITLDRIKSSKAMEANKEYIVKPNHSNLNSGLKLTIKNPKHKQSSSHHKSSSGKSTPELKSSSPSHKLSDRKSLSSKTSSSSSGRSSPYSKEKDKKSHMSSSSSSGSKEERKNLEKKRESGGHGHRQEEVKKLLSQNSKFDKTFQIPKISKCSSRSSSPSHTKYVANNSNTSPKLSPSTPPKLNSKLTSPVKSCHSHSKITERFITDPYAVIPPRPDDQKKRPPSSPPNIKLPSAPNSRSYDEISSRPSALAEMLPPAHVHANNLDIIGEIDMKRTNASPTVSLHIVKSPAPRPVQSPRSQLSPVEMDDTLMDEALLMTKWMMWEEAGIDLCGILDVARFI